jgi:DNA-binding GntR family transcriptional regulator
MDPTFPSGGEWQQSEGGAGYGVIFRGVLRSTIRLPQTSGLVTVLPNHGTLVRRLILEEALDPFDTRAGLAYTGGRLAARHATDETMSEMQSLQLAMVELLRWRRHNFGDFARRARRPKSRTRL